MSDTYYAELATLLRISGIGVPPWSARGLTQTLEPIEAAKANWRTINGGLLDVSAPQFRKYRSTISCTDQNPPAFSRLWPGRTLVIDCVAELSYVTEGGTPERPVVSAPGASRIEGVFTIYRPRLTMKCLSFQKTQDEYQASVSWTLELEEE
jgi:hypothetical protein